MHRSHRVPDRVRHLSSLSKHFFDIQTMGDVQNAFDDAAEAGGVGDASLGVAEDATRQHNSKLGALYKYQYYDHLIA